MKLFKNFKIKTRLVLLVALPILFLLMEGVQKQMHDGHIVQTRFVKELVLITSVAEGVINRYTEKYESGELTKSEASKMALEEISKIRYKGGSYFFAMNKEGVVLTHPDYRLVGKKLGVPEIDSFINEMSRQGAAIVHYSWENRPKTTYGVHVHDFDWYIATGGDPSELQIDFINGLIHVVSLTVFALILSLILAIHLTHGFKTQIKRINVILDEASKGREFNNLKVFDKSELGILGRKTNMVVSGLLLLLEITREENNKLKSELKNK